MVEVTQADREAALPFIKDDIAAYLIRSEKYDHHPLVRTLARHREAAAAEERAWVVEYIRKEQLDDYHESIAKETEAWWFADQFEAGKHLK